MITIFNHREAPTIAALVRFMNAASGWPMGTKNRCVIIDTPEGQLAWSYGAEFDPLFNQLPVYGGEVVKSSEDGMFKLLTRVIAKMDEYSAIVQKDALKAKEAARSEESNEDELSGN